MRRAVEAIAPAGRDGARLARQALIPAGPLPQGGAAGREALGLMGVESRMARIEEGWTQAAICPLTG